MKGLLVFLLLAARAGALDLPLGSLRLPAGFHIAIFADTVPGARSLALGAAGTVFVGTRGEGRVYALVDRDGDGRAEGVHVIASGLKQPNGVAFRGGSLYVAEIGRVLRFDGIEERLERPPQPVVVSEGFPTDAHHGWKFIRFGPDGLLYVPVGVPCNICLRDDERYGSIMRMKPDGSGLEVFARGVRNSVGFDWQPGTGDLWFTDNGRDYLGDNAPPDELNRASRPGQHFGFPFVHGSTARTTAPRSSRYRRASWGPTSRPSACAFTGEGSFPQPTGGRSSSRSTGRGTGRLRSATGSAWCASTTAGRCRTRPLPRDGSRAAAPGGDPWI